MPHEVLQLHELAQLKRDLEASAGDPARGEVLRQRIAELQQLIALRLERLRLTGSL